MGPTMRRQRSGSAGTAVLAMLATLTMLTMLAACGEPARTSAHDPHAPRATPVAKPPERQRTDIFKVAYRYELALHASDADREQFGAYFLDYPAEQEGEYIAAFARNTPPVRQRSWCRFTSGQAVVDLMTSRPGISFVANLEKVDGDTALVTMTWWSDPELAASALIALRRRDGAWEVTGYQPLWVR
jgi:hypothetical protein